MWSRTTRSASTTPAFRSTSRWEREIRRSTRPGARIAPIATRRARSAWTRNARTKKQTTGRATRRRRSWSGCGSSLGRSRRSVRGTAGRTCPRATRWTWPWCAMGSARRGNATGCGSSGCCIRTMRFAHLRICRLSTTATTRDRTGRVRAAGARRSGRRTRWRPKSWLRGWNGGTRSRARCSRSGRSPPWPGRCRRGTRRFGGGWPGCSIATSKRGSWGSTGIWPSWPGGCWGVRLPLSMTGGRITASTTRTNWWQSGCASWASSCHRLPTTSRSGSRGSCWTRPIRRLART